jgi:hypothetical protein
MGALLNASIFMEPLSNCTCCEARQIPIYQSTPFLKYIQMRYSPIKCFTAPIKVLSQIAFQNFKWRSRLKARQPKYLFSPDTQHVYLPEGARCGGSVREASPVEERRAEFADSDLEPDGTARRTATPGSPRVHEGNGVWQKRAFSRAVDKF